MAAIPTTTILDKSAIITPMQDTDVFWATRGTGATRDKQATWADMYGSLISTVFPAITSFGFGTAPVANQPLTIGGGAAKKTITWDDGHQWIGYNDSTGGGLIKWGAGVGSGGIDYYDHGGSPGTRSAAKISVAYETTIPRMSLMVAPVGNDGDPITWGESIRIGENLDTASDDGFGFFYQGVKKFFVNRVGAIQILNDVAMGSSGTDFQFDSSLGAFGINKTPVSGVELAISGTQRFYSGNNYLSMTQSSNQSFITPRADTGGNAELLISPVPNGGAGGAFTAKIKLFQFTTATGNVAVELFKGDGTATIHSRLGVNGIHSYFTNTNIHIGGSSAPSGNVLEVTGNAQFNDNVTINNATNLNSPVSLQQLTHYSAGVWFTGNSASDNNWQSVTYGNGLFVAVSNSGTGNRVMTSPDGITWTSRTSAADNSWQSVTYGNGLFVAVSITGTGNRVMTSPDGITWTSRTSASDNSWRGVTYGNGLFVAVSGTGTGNRVMTSPDGITWTSRTSAADNTWNGVTYGNGLFVAVSSSGTGNRVMTSPDGITWTSRTSAADNDWREVTYGNGLFVAVSDTGTGNRVMTSPDGITWTSRTSASDNIWQSVTYGNGLFVAVSITGIGNRVMTSPDGITWTSRTSAADNDWREVTYGNGLFVAVSSTGTGDRAMHTSKLL